MLARTNLNTLNQEQRIELAKETYQHTSYFQRKFWSDNKTFACATLSENLRAHIERLLITKGIIQASTKLEELHNKLSDEMRGYNFNDGVNKITAEFYETDEAFAKAYIELIRFVRNELVDEPFYFQSIPTIRLHCPNALNSNHYPRYHTDIGYGHPPEEINLWLPLTEAIEPQFHGFRIMNLEHSREILNRFNFNFESFIHEAINNKEFSNECDRLSSQVTTPFKSIYAFDSRCIHTGEPLIAHTRVSIDIRVLPVSEYNKMTIEYQGSGRRKIIFNPGNCYHELNSDQFLN